MGSAVFIRPCHIVLKVVFSAVKPFSSISLLTLFVHCIDGLPLPLLLPTLLVKIDFITLCSLLLFTCPNHLSLASHNFSVILTTPDLLLISSFLSLSFNVTPKIHLNIFISVLSNFSSSFFLITHVSDSKNSSSFFYHRPSNPDY